MKRDKVRLLRIVYALLLLDMDLCTRFVASCFRRLFVLVGFPTKNCSSPNAHEGLSARPTARLTLFIRHLLLDGKDLLSRAAVSSFTRFLRLGAMAIIQLRYDTQSHTFSIDAMVFDSCLTGHTPAKGVTSTLRSDLP